MIEYFSYTNYQAMISVFFFCLIVLTGPLLMYLTRNLHFTTIILILFFIISLYTFPLHTHQTISFEESEYINNEKLDPDKSIINYNDIEITFNISSTDNISSNDENIIIGSDRLKIYSSNTAFLLFFEKEEEYTLNINGQNHSVIVESRPEHRWGSVEDIASILS